MKKFVSLLVSSVMIFSSAVYAEDLDTGFWAYGQVMEAKSDGWFDGLDANSNALKSTAQLALSSVFKNNFSETAADMGGGYIKRGELASYLQGFLPRDNRTLQVSFSDISESEHSYSIQRCANAGLLNGYADGTFKPDNPVTNAELAVIISNLKKNREEALELYNRVDEKYKELKSFTMDVNSNINMTMKILGADSEKVKIAMTGSLKTIVNDLEKFDIEMSGSLDSSYQESIKQKMNLYYNDNTYYIDTDGVKIKMEVDFNKMMSDMGLNYYDIAGDLEESSFILGYVKKNADGTKDLYAEIDANDIISDLKVMPENFAGELKLANFSTIMHIDENGNILSYDAYCDMRIGDDNSCIDYEMESDYTLRDIDNTVIDKPEGLDEYKDIKDFVITVEGGDEAKPENFIFDDGEDEAEAYDLYLPEAENGTDVVINTPEGTGSAGAIS